MRYFKNSELVRLYNVSDKTVRNWISAAQAGKIELELFTTEARKTYIADTLNNAHALDLLVARGKRYRNQRAHKILKPTNEFYNLYSDTQVLDIIANIDTYRELPLSYKYLGEGASLWEAYLQKLNASPTANLLGQTIDLLHTSLDYIGRMANAYKYVNVVDIGVGNGMPACEILAYLRRTNKLKKYIGIDLSPALLDIAERRILAKLDGINIEKHVRNVTYQRFGELLKSDSYGEDASSTLNVILFFGGTIGNFREPTQALQTIRESMSKNDLLITSARLDSANTRRFFDFNTGLGLDKVSVLPSHLKYSYDLLSIDETLYDIEQIYDQQAHSRFIQARLKTSLTIDFEVGSFQKSIELQKGEALICWRVQHFSPYELIELYRRNGLGLVQAVTSENQEYMLMISRIVSDITR